MAACDSKQAVSPVSAFSQQLLLLAFTFSVEGLTAAEAEVEPARSSADAATTVNTALADNFIVSPFLGTEPEGAGTRSGGLLARRLMSFWP